MLYTNRQRWFYSFDSAPYFLTMHLILSKDTQLLWSLPTILAFKSPVCPFYKQQDLVKNPESPISL